MRSLLDHCLISISDSYLRALPSGEPKDAALLPTQNDYGPCAERWNPCWLTALAVRSE